MSIYNVPDEYMHCFNVMDEIPVSDPMEIETVQNDLYNTVGLEWHYWGQPEISKKVAEPDVKKLMDLSSYQGFRQNISMSSETSEAHAKEKKDSSSKLSPVKVSNSKVRGSYRSYNPEQIQELLDLVIEGGLSARKAGMMVGIVERTAQHYVKFYRDDEEKRLPGLRKPRIKWHMKLEPQHTDFLCTFYGENPEAVLWQARESLLQAFPEIKSISLSGLHKHLVQHASLTLKKLERVVTARAAHNNLNLRKERVLEWKADKNMDWENRCVFIDEAGFNMHIRRNFGRSKRGTPAKTLLPSNRGITVIIIGAICEKGVIDLTLRKPKAVQKKAAHSKKRKRKDGKAEDVEVNTRVGTRSEHFLEFLSNVMDTLDQKSPQT